MSKWGSTQMNKEKFNMFFTKEFPATERVTDCYNRFMHFCEVNDFDLFCLPPMFHGPDTAAKVLAMDQMHETTVGWFGLNRIFKRPVVNAHSFYFWNRKTNKRCFVSNAYIPTNVNHLDWIQSIQEYMKDYGLEVQVFPKCGFCAKNAVLVVFSVNGDISE